VTATVRRLGAEDLEAMRGINALYAEAFEDPEHYAAVPPDDAWLAAHLADRHVIALVAEDAGRVIVGALTGYILPKLEQARSEIYIYDLAVAESHRRQGIATALIEALQPIGRAAGAWVIYVQADYGDEPAVALYTKLGEREDVMHFDIAVKGAA
jgi:aminoglycoside 3-N-acetyltransferase I